MGTIRLNMRGLAVAAIIGTGSVLPVAQAQAPAPRFPTAQGPRVTSPEVAADGRVTFRILAPKSVGFYSHPATVIGPETLWWLTDDRSPLNSRRRFEPPRTQARAASRLTDIA